MSFLRANYRPTRRKMFGLPGPQPLDRNAKVRIMTTARALLRRTVPGKHYGVLKAKALAVLQALLWVFHGKRGHCFAAYKAIAKEADCARSTVAAAIQALDSVGVLTWVHGIERKRGDDGVNRVVRTSNRYRFTDPGAGAEPRGAQPTGVSGNSSKSDSRPGTEIRSLSSSLSAPRGARNPIPSYVGRPCTPLLDSTRRRLGLI
jgi:hypothetical protein